LGRGGRGPIKLILGREKKRGGGGIMEELQRRGPLVGRFRKEAKGAEKRKNNATRRDSSFEGAGKINKKNTLFRRIGLGTIKLT